MKSFENEVKIVETADTTHGWDRIEMH